MLFLTEKNTIKSLAFTKNFKSQLAQLYAGLADMFSGLFIKIVFFLFRVASRIRT